MSKDEIDALKNGIGGAYHKDENIITGELRTKPSVRKESFYEYEKKFTKNNIDTITEENHEPKQEELDDMFRPEEKPTHYATVTFDFLLNVGALDGKLMGIITMYENLELSQAKFVELVIRSYNEYKESNNAK